MLRSLTATESMRNAMSAGYAIVISSALMISDIAPQSCTHGFHVSQAIPC